MVVGGESLGLEEMQCGAIVTEPPGGIKMDI